MYLLWWSRQHCMFLRLLNEFVILWEGKPAVVWCTCWNFTGIDDHIYNKLNELVLSFSKKHCILKQLAVNVIKTNVFTHTEQYSIHSHSIVYTQSVAHFLFSQAALFSLRCCGEFDSNDWGNHFSSAAWIQLAALGYTSSSAPFRFNIHVK